MTKPETKLGTPFDHCRRIYWQGTHWQRMRTLLAAAG